MNMNLNQPADARRMPATVAGALSRHWGWFLLEGLVLIVLGVAAILLPAAASLAATVLVGWLLLLSGIVGLITTLRARHTPGFAWSLLSALLALGAGAVLLLLPLQAMFSLTAVLIAFLVAEGVISIFYALEHRRGASGRWHWMLLSGALDILLGVLLVAGFPGSALWALGLMLGINLCFGGWALVMMALAARGLAGGTPASQF
jgi:uncharacterized membrane protein HdeD (DUF308 family)